MILLSGSAPVQVMAIGQPRYIETTESRGRIPLVAGGVATTIVVDAGDWPGVRRAATDLQADIARVTGVTPTLVHAPPASAAQLVIIGTIGSSPLIDRLVREQEDRRGRRSRANGSRSSSRPSTTRCPASAPPSSSPAATSAARSTASTICPNRSACRPGTGGRMSRPSGRPRCS